MTSGYLLDTNTVSETRKLHPNRAVIDFLDSLDESVLFLSVLTLGELYKGIKMKHRKDPSNAARLSHWLNEIEKTYADRILLVDSRIVKLWGELSANRSMPVIDTLIAATARVHNLSLVTRNIADFKSANAALINPWQD